MTATVKFRTNKGRIFALTKVIGQTGPYDYLIPGSTYAHDLTAGERIVQANASLAFWTEGPEGTYLMARRYAYCTFGPEYGVLPAVARSATATGASDARPPDRSATSVAGRSLTSEPSPEDSVAARTVAEHRRPRWRSCKYKAETRRSGCEGGDPFGADAGEPVPSIGPRLRLQLLLRHRCPLRLAHSLLSQEPRALNRRPGPLVRAPPSRRWTRAVGLVVSCHIGSMNSWAERVSASRISMIPCRVASSASGSISMSRCRGDTGLSGLSSTRSGSGVGTAPGETPVGAPGAPKTWSRTPSASWSTPVVSKYPSLSKYSATDPFFEVAVAVKVESLAVDHAVFVGVGECGVVATVTTSVSQTGVFDAVAVCVERSPFRRS